jgi:hypothetical protein
MLGEQLELRRPATLEVGAEVDWWTIRQYAPNRLVLGTTRWFCGEAWLGYRIAGEPEARMEQVGALRTKGLPGWLYWRAVWPVHQVVFRVMARKQVSRARALSRVRGVGGPLSGHTEAGTGSAVGDEAVRS